MKLTTDSKERKNTPIVTGVLDYFPLALAGIARVSKKGNDKHNPGQPLHYCRSDLWIGYATNHHLGGTTIIPKHLLFGITKDMSLVSNKVAGL